MVSALRNRLARLESRRADTFMAIIVSGGVPGEIEHAQAGELRFRRAEDEPLEDFVERTKAAAQAHGESLLVVGGLPPR